MKAVCGLDVHKDSIFLCILHSDGELFEQVFGVLTFQLHEMCKLLKKTPCFRSFNGKYQHLLDTNLACAVSSFYTPPCQSVFYQATSRS